MDMDKLEKEGGGGILKNNKMFPVTQLLAFN